MPRSRGQASNNSVLGAPMMKSKRSRGAPMMESMGARVRETKAAPRRNECEGMAMMSAAPAMLGAPVMMGMAAESSSACDDDLMMRLNALDAPMKRSASPVM